jgi:hypothetical protein
MKKVICFFVSLLAMLSFSISVFAADVMPAVGSNLFWNDIISNYTLSALLIYAIFKLVAIVSPVIPNSSIIELLRRWFCKFPVVKRSPITIYKDQLKLIPTAFSQPTPAKKKSKA